MPRTAARIRLFSTWALGLLVACTLFTFWASPGCADAAPAVVSEWPLAANDLEARSIVTGADGNLWLGVSRYDGPGQYNEPTFEGLLDRVSPDAEVATFRLGEFGPIALSPGSDGNLWFLGYEEVGYVSPAGQITRFSLPEATSLESDLVAGRDGNMWATNRNDTGGDTIIRISPTGQMTRFSLPHRESGPADIAVGPEGNLWFGETFTDRIGRITTSGQITEFPVGERVSDLTAGPDGNIWFSTEGGRLRRLSPEGNVTRLGLKPGRFVNSPILAGPDGRLWFGEGRGWIGRISPSGRFSRVRLPQNGRRVNSLTIGPEGAVWFLAVHAETCNGGGFTCMNWIPSRNAMFGRVVPGSLEVAVRRSPARVHRGGAAIRLGCEEGNADDVCRGSLTLEQSGTADASPLGSVSYELHTDSNHTFRVRLRRSSLARLSRRGRLDVNAIVSLDGGATVSHRVTLLAAGR